MKKGEEYYCDECGTELDPARDHIQEPDPYDSEIRHDDTLYDRCHECWKRSGDEI